MEEKNKTVRVAAALIERDGKYLIFQRPEHKQRGLKWEFVGGKIEEGESPEEALKRECREELGVEVDVGELFMSLTHAYSDLTVKLCVYKASISSGEIRLMEHRAMASVESGELRNYPFCDADRAVLEKLAEE